jgi:hypothetical protein
MRITDMNLDNFNAKYNTSINNLKGLFEYLDDVRAHNKYSGSCRDEICIDYSDLPIFGGLPPQDTLGIWSWDENSFIVGQGEFELVDRVKFAQRMAA